MRVWDIHPGYLNRQSLLGEHVEIHAVISVVRQQKKGYANHPETKRWQQHLEALYLRHDMVAAEMELRNFNHQSPACKTQFSSNRTPVWPDMFVDLPAKQYGILRKKYEDREQGRIPLPGSHQILWSQHKYSVMARDYNLYKSIGAKLADKKLAFSIDAFETALVNILRQEPPPEQLLNALQHMWGYVSEYAAGGDRKFQMQNPQAMLMEISWLAMKKEIKYLQESTALSDLAVWL